MATTSMPVKVLPVAEAAIQARDQWSPYVDNGGFVFFVFSNALLSDNCV
jgi:hypothetical protein